MLCWIGVERVDILVQFHTFMAKLLTIPCSVWHWHWVFYTLRSCHDRFLLCLSHNFWHEVVLYLTNAFHAIYCDDLCVLLFILLIWYNAFKINKSLKVLIPITRALSSSSSHLLKASSLNINTLRAQFEHRVWSSTNILTTAPVFYSFSLV